MNAKNYGGGHRRKVHLYKNKMLKRPENPRGPFCEKNHTKREVGTKKEKGSYHWRKRKHLPLGERGETRGHHESDLTLIGGF